MSVKTFKPTSAGMRHTMVADFSGLSKVRPEKSLLENLKRTGGRNSYGRITVRHIGGGHKRKYRLIDFKRDKIDIPGWVKTLEYDPNRTTRIALVVFADGERRYILAPVDLQVGDQVISSDTADIKPGNTLTLGLMPIGTLVHNLEMQAGQGGKLVRSAGTAAQIMGREGDYCQVKMPSGGNKRKKLSNI